MPLLNDNCGNCHTLLRGREKDMALSKYSPASYAEHCKEEVRERTVDRGKMIEHITETRTIARCPVCGRKEALDWLIKSVEKEWKDEGCD